MLDSSGSRRMGAADARTRHYSGRMRRFIEARVHPAWVVVGVTFLALLAAAGFRSTIGVFIVPLGFWLGASGVERALLVGSWVLVMIVELLNSAIEATVDRVGTEHHQLAGRAKDIGSASVFLAISLALLVWALVLLPRYL